MFSIPLVFPVVAVIARLDPTATRADPPGAQTVGYEDAFGEPAVLPSDDRVGTSARVEQATVSVPCQFEDGTYDKQDMHAAGDSPDSRVVLVMHRDDLAELDLISATTGDALITKGDRLVRLEATDGTLIQTIPDPPGLFVTEARPIGADLGQQWNLLMVRLDDRERAA